MSKAVTSDDSSNDPNPLTFTEIEIPVPWGKIAAMTCGDSSSHPILCLHGLLDNSASFDRLMHALSLKSHFFVSIDLPGHGKSSHLEPGTQYRFLDFLTVVLRIKQYFQWERFSIIGHEMGGLLGLYFAAYFPKAVEKLVVLNPVCYLTRNKDQSQRFIKTAETAYKVQHQPKEITFTTLTDALDYILNLRKTKLSSELLPVLLRNVCPVGNVYMLSIDSRISALEFPVISEKQLYQIFNKITCELFIITSSDKREDFKMLPVAYFTRLFKKNCERFGTITLKGDTDLHLHKPKTVSSQVRQLFLDFRSSL
ncbi:serine hydrolase-like protein isoform X1 [Schistocerca piceifrons]|uniref:serine hydrolase-like protein isoform X1 n=2 Tax=Schistocerca piceifrons TaxID=274613 RepID=UPI001F5F7FA4|nr:serine hydrolase-like protein isoform X1 [Schistocerca piceifrons]